MSSMRPPIPGGGAGSSRPPIVGGDVSPGRPQLDDAERATMYGQLSPTTASQSPSTIGTVAGNTDMSDLQVASLAREVEVINWAADAQRAWERMSDEARLDYWGRLSQTERNILSDQGIAPPERNRFLRAVKDVGGAVLKHNPIVAGARQGLELLGKFERAKDHYVRANLRMQEASEQIDPEADHGGLWTGGIPILNAIHGFGQGLVPATFKPGTWKKFWDLTSDGEETFWASTLDELEDRGITGEQLELAKGLASHLNTSKQDATRDELDQALLTELADMVEAGDLTREEAGGLGASIRDELDRPDSEFVTAVNTLGRNKLSAGRMAALGAGAKPGTAAYHRISGLGDTVDSFIDPILIGGSAVKVARAARWGVRGSQQIATRSLRRAARAEIGALDNPTSLDVSERLTEIIRRDGAEQVLRPQVRRWTSKMAGALNDEVALRVERLNVGQAPAALPAEQSRAGVAGLLREEPKFSSVITRAADSLGFGKPGGLQEAGIIGRAEDGSWMVRREVDDADILGYFTSAEGTRSILTGRMAGHLVSVPVMPHISLQHIPFKKAKAALEAPINWMDDAPVRAWEKIQKAGRITDGELLSALEEGSVRWNLRTAGKVGLAGHPVLAATTMANATVGRLVKYATTTAPARVVDLNSSDAITQVQRLGNYLPRRIADDMVNEFAATTSTAERFAVMRSMFDEIFTRTGVKQTPEGADWADNFLRGMTEHAGQRYALDGLDDLPLPSGKVQPSAVILQQTATSMRLPDVKQLFAYSKRSSFWYHATGARIFNTDFWDFAMGRVWAPSVLIRLGFPIRAGGDEALQFMLREGGTSWLRARFAVSGQSDKALLNPLWRVFDFMHQGVRNHVGFYDQAVDRFIDAVRRSDPHRMFGLYRTTRALAELADLPRRGVRWTERALTPRSIEDAMTSLSRHSDHFLSRQLTDVYAASQGSHLYRYEQHLNEAEQKLAESRVLRDPEQWYMETRWTGKWDELSVDENSDLFFAHFQNRMRDLLEEDDTRIGLQLLRDHLDEAVAEAVRLPGGVLSNLSRITESAEFTSRWVDEWLAAVDAQPALREALLTRLQRTSYLPDGRIWPGVDEPGQMLQPKFGVAVSRNGAMPDGFGIHGSQVEGGMPTFGDGVVVRFDADVDAVLDDGSLLGLGADEVAVHEVDHLGDWKPFRPHSDHLDPDDFTAVRAEVDRLIRDEGLLDDVVTSTNRVATELDRLWNDLDDLIDGDLRAAMRAAIDQFRDDWDATLLGDRLIDIRRRFTLDQPGPADDLIDIGRPRDLTEQGAAAAGANLESDRLLLEINERIAALQDEIGPVLDELSHPLLRFASDDVLREVLPANLRNRMAAPLADADELRLFNRMQTYLIGDVADGVAEYGATQLDRALIGGLQDALQRRGYTGWEFTDDAGRYAQVFDRSLLTVDQTRVAADLQKALEKFATSDDALRALGAQQLRLLKQRTFTRPAEGKAAMPIPGVLDELVEGRVPDVRDLKTLHYSDTEVQARFADRYGDLIDENVTVPASEILGQFSDEIAETMPWVHGMEDFRNLADNLDDMTLSMDPEEAGAVSDLVRRISRELDDDLNREALDWEAVSTSLPDKTFGPGVETGLKNLAYLFWEKPMAAMGAGIDYISRQPMFAHYLAKGRELISDGLWEARHLEKGILDDMVGSVDGVGSDLSAKQLERAGRRAYVRDLDAADDIVIQPTGKGTLAGYDPTTGRITIDRDAIRADYDEGLSYLRGRQEGSVGSLQKAEVFERQGVDLDELYEWFEAHGGAEAYERFIVAHERAHAELGHQAIGRHEFMADHALVQEMEANQAAFHAMQMPWAGDVAALEFTDAKHALEYLQTLKGRASRARRAGFAADDDIVLAEDALGTQLAEVARRAERAGFARHQGEGDLAFTERLFERVWDAEGEVFEGAFEYALNHTLPFVDSVPTASFMATIGRNMVPFWWAEERFIKRLAQSLYHSPAGIKKMQLTYLGLRHVGAIQTDDNGVDYFVYPGTALTHYATAATLSAITGEDYHVPQLEQVRGRMLMSLPGLDEMGRPTPGPAIALPLRWLGDRFPHLNDQVTSVIGDYAANRNISNWSMIFPSTIARAWAARDPKTAREQYASAHLQAVQTLMANGHDVEVDPATGVLRPQDPEDFDEKAARLTHIIAGLRVIYGFAGFAPPEIEFPDGNEAREALFNLTSVYGFAEGLAQWQEQYPNATPYQVFSTETAGGTSIPSTAETFEYMDRHGDFLERYPEAAAYLIPAPPVDSKFEFRAWQKQADLGLRSRRDSVEFIRAVRFAQAAPAYFDMQALYEQTRERYKGTSYAAEIDNRWHRWQQNYYAMHPTFHDELTSSERMERRRSIVRELTAAYEDPDLPLNDTVASMRKMLDGYKAYEHQMSLLSGFNRKQHQAFRKQFKERFLVWTDWMLEAHPEVEPFVLRVVYPELRTSDEEVEQMMQEVG